MTASSTRLLNSREIGLRGAEVCQHEWSCVICGTIWSGTLTLTGHPRTRMKVWGPQTSFLFLRQTHLLCKRSLMNKQESAPDDQAPIWMSATHFWWVGLESACGKSEVWTANMALIALTTWTCKSAISKAIPTQWLLLYICVWNSVVIPASSLSSGFH